MSRPAPAQQQQPAAAAASSSSSQQPQPQPQQAQQSTQQHQGGSRKISFNVSDQYDIQDVVGEGAYGVVW